MKKGQLFAACLELGVLISEIARNAGVHWSQLFRWRKEPCRIESLQHRYRARWCRMPHRHYLGFNRNRLLHTSLVVSAAM
ncbi:transposase [Rhizobium sp. CG4]|nr:transposase [Rhizobium sp. CG4]